MIEVRDLGSNWNVLYTGDKPEFFHFLNKMISIPGASKLKTPGWKLPKCYLPELEEQFQINYIENPWDNIGQDMKLPPYVYQKETIHFAINNPNSLLILPTGSGKF